MTGRHECLYSCVQNCCNYFGRCPEDYLDTIVASDKRYSECFDFASDTYLNDGGFFNGIRSENVMFVGFILAIVLLLIVNSIRSINRMRSGSKL
jgi:hypothetical protein